MRHNSARIEEMCERIDTLDTKVEHMDSRLLKTEMHVERIVEGRKEFRAWALGIIGTIIGAVVVAYLTFGNK